MPRRPPATVRSALPRRPRPYDRPGRVVPTLSAPAQRQTAEFERRHDRPGSVADAVAAWSRLVHALPPFADRNDWDDSCPCCTQTLARELLEDALHKLPPGAARELRAVVRPLDAVFLDRVAPEPRLADAPDWWTYLHRRRE
ncbi:hypothetical protein [Streptomyces sp. ISL-11]|uniref:hypothetical protein n=1 Tax=Streptomyces sp. ISL-11 TaxID=2819174 RepID=UPI001BE68D48|nr:hypothetical protein [Streptomyces sp. ISL-11]MBT2384705.1 hypothetical protein [Streptomyces sp. ISL-11]